MTAVPLSPPVAAVLLGGPGPDLDAHLRAHGPLTPPGDLVGLVEAAGLTGRGGSGFPTARKLAAVVARRDPSRASSRAPSRSRFRPAPAAPVVVANGAEGEPLSHKDVTLLSVAPHLVLDGLDLVARALGASAAYVAVADGGVAHLLRLAVAARPGGAGPRPEVVEVPARFVTGQESALVNAVSGRPAVPSDPGVPVWAQGVRGRPTAVHNVETLAHLALIARHGPGWFRSTGTPDEPGSMLVTLSGDLPRPGVVEVAQGTPLAAVVGRGGGRLDAAEAVLVGGFHGAWLPRHTLPRVLLSRAGLRAYDASPGAGVVHVLGPDRCGLVESAGTLDYLAGQSAGQCGPCVNGLPAMATALSRLASGRVGPASGAELTADLTRLGALVTGRGACAHPDGTARFVASTLRVFAAEVDLHLRGGCRVQG